MCYLKLEGMIADRRISENFDMSPSVNDRMWAACGR
jgi:hypothetical protein